MSSSPSLLYSTHPPTRHYGRASCHQLSSSYMRSTGPHHSLSLSLYTTTTVSSHRPSLVCSIPVSPHLYHPTTTRPLPSSPTTQTHYAITTTPLTLSPSLSTSHHNSTFSIPFSCYSEPRERQNIFIMQVTLAPSLPLLYALSTITTITVTTCLHHR